MYLDMSEADHPEVANLDLDDTVEMTVIGKVTSISRPTFMEPMAEGVEGKRANLDIAITQMKIKPVDLHEAIQRAGEKEGLLVRTRTEPAP